MADVTRDVDEARAELARWSHTDPTYAELMATYAALGELLGSGLGDDGYEAECRMLARRLAALGAQQQHEWEERWAMWCARTNRAG